MNDAVVRISMVGFDAGQETFKLLDGEIVMDIHANLASGAGTVGAAVLLENNNLCFMGASPKGKFDLSADVARRMLEAPLNVNGRPNSDVLRKVMSGIDIVGSPRNKWTIYFAANTTRDQAAQYEMPFEYLLKHSLPDREKKQREAYRQNWWLYGRPRPEMLKALIGKKRYIATPATAKHRVFVWVQADVLCNQGTLVFAREDDYFFGVLHSSAHELWALTMGTQLESRPRYTPNSTFDTFPFPWPPGTEPSGAEDGRVRAVAEAARELAARRDAWLHPPDATEEQLKEKTLTKLYNQRPEWLAGLHRALDAAVFAVYGWPDRLGKQEVLARLLALNGERAGAKAPTGVAQHSRG